MEKERNDKSEKWRATERAKHEQKVAISSDGKKPLAYSDYCTQVLSLPG